MKRVVSALLTVAMVFTMLFAMTIPASAAMLSPNYEFYAKNVGTVDGEAFTGVVPKIDGIINSDEWIESDFKSWLNPSTAGHKSAFYYDELYLYGATRVNKDSYQIPIFPSYYWVGHDRCRIWIDPLDEAKDFTETKYFIEILTAFCDNNLHGSQFTTEAMGTKIPGNLIYCKNDIEMRSNIENAWDELTREVSRENVAIGATNEYDPNFITLSKKITWENDTTMFSLPLESGTWDIEFKIPFELFDMIVDEDFYTDNEDYGTYFAISGWIFDCSNYTLDALRKAGSERFWDTGQFTEAYLAGRNRHSFDYAPVYFVKQRPGEKPLIPGKKAPEGINPSGEVERSNEENGGIAVKDVAGIKFDGKVDDSVWDMKKMLRNESNDFDTYYDIKWDKEYIYVAIDSADPTITTPESMAFSDLNKPGANPAEYDFLRIDINPGCTGMPANQSEKSFSLYFPRSSMNDAEFFVNMQGQGFKPKTFNSLENSGIMYNAKGQLEEGSHWTAEFKIPISMFNYGETEMFPTSEKLEDFYGERFQYMIAYCDSQRETTIETTTAVTIEEDPDSGVTSEVEYPVTSEVERAIPVYNSSVTGVSDPYLFPICRMVKDAGTMTKKVEANKVVYTGNKTYFEENTYNLRYEFDNEGKEEVEVNIPVANLNRQNYTSYYINFDGYKIDIPSGLLTNNLLEKDETVKLTDTLKIKAKLVSGVWDKFTNEKQVEVRMSINGKNIIPRDYFRVTMYKEATSEVTDEAVKGIDVNGQKYPMTYKTYFETVDAKTEAVTAKANKIKTRIPGTYGFVENKSSVDDIENNESVWGQEFMEKAIAYGIMEGSDGKFKPLDNLTRAETAVIIMRALQLSNDIEKVENFSDIPKSGGDFGWASQMIYAAKALGIVNGRDNNRYEPDGTITRAEFFKMFYNAIGRTDLKFPETDYSILNRLFNSTDFYMLNSDGYRYAYDGAAFLISNGIVGGSAEDDGKLYIRLENNITRQEVAKIISKFTEDYVIPHGNKMTKD